MYVNDITTYFFRTDFSAPTFQRFDHTGASFESREYWQCSDATRFETPDSLIWKRSWGRDHLALNLLVALGWRTFQSHVPFTGLCVIDSALPMKRMWLECTSVHSKGSDNNHAVAVRRQDSPIRQHPHGDKGRDAPIRYLYRYRYRYWRHF